MYRSFFKSSQKYYFLKGDFIMKKITKTIVAILLIAILSVTNIVAFATNEWISPRLSHAGSADLFFSATENGGIVEATYNGYSSFVRADLSVKVQKRFLLVFWNDVAEWNASSTKSYDYFSHTFSLDGSGMYRAIFTLTITGNDGTVDIIERTIESKY